MVFTALIFMTVVARPYIRIPQNLLLAPPPSEHISVDLESPQAFYERGVKLMLSGSLSDAQKGLSLLEMSATQGDGKAACELAAYYRWMHPDDVELARWMCPCAEQRPTADRETVMAELYLEGRGVSLNMSEAVRWYERAATHGGTEARRFLFYLYRNGNGDVQPNNALARRYAIALTQYIPADEDAVNYLLEQARERNPDALAWAHEWNHRLKQRASPLFYNR